MIEVIELKPMDFFIFRLARDGSNNLIIDNKDGFVKVNVFKKNNGRHTLGILNVIYNNLMSQVFTEFINTHNKSNTELKYYTPDDSELNNKSEFDYNKLIESMKVKDIYYYMNPELILSILTFETEFVTAYPIVYGDSLSEAYDLVDDITNNDIKDLQKLTDNNKFKS